MCCSQHALWLDLWCMDLGCASEFAGGTQRMGIHQSPVCHLQGDIQDKGHRDQESTVLGLTVSVLTPERMWPRPTASGAQSMALNSFPVHLALAVPCI